MRSLPGIDSSESLIFISQCQHDCARLDQSIGTLGIGSYVSWYDPTGTSSVASTPNLPPADLFPDGAATSTESFLPVEPIHINLESPSAILVEAPDRTSSPASTKGDKTPTATPSTPRSRSRSFTRESGFSATTPIVTTFPKNEKPTLTPTPKDRYFPLATATLETSVFDVVHIFSERGISAVPIVDADGMVINLYETVDIVVRLSLSSI